jgi:tetratricopeptide (TPR) repeat protein
MLNNIQNLKYIMMKKNILLCAICILIAGLTRTSAQDMLVATKVSQRASVIQRIGTTDVTVVYHSPLAKNRKIFGGIVPYNFVVDGVEYPWRAGSNENTTIEFTHDVMIQDQPLSKGKYGLHIFVNDKEWTYIFSNNSESWGSFSYNKKEDALRVIATPEKTAYKEWLNYEFVAREPESSVLELHWSDVKCGIKISVDVTSNILADLISKEEKTIDDYIKMAQLTNNLDPSNIDQAMKYVDQSLVIGEEFRNMMLKSELLLKNGQKKESEKFKEEAIALGKGFPYYYYYTLSFMLLERDKEKTLSLLSDILKKDPSNWIANLAMGEYFIKEGNQEKATLHYRKAYENAGEASKPYTRYMYLSNKIILEQ